MGVKLEDVARRAGVSKATVSLALNGSDRINAQTRARIERLAMEMGYIGPTPTPESWPCARAARSG